MDACINALLHASTPVTANRSSSWPRDACDQCPWIVQAERKVKGQNVRKRDHLQTKETWVRQCQKRPNVSKRALKETWARLW